MERQSSPAEDISHQQRVEVEEEGFIDFRERTQEIAAEAASDCVSLFAAINIVVIFATEADVASFAPSKRVVARVSQQRILTPLTIQKVAAITAGQSYIRHIAAADIAGAVGEGKFTASTDFARVREVEAVIICDPTPLNKNREPDISFIIKTGNAIAPHLQRGTLVVLESTTYPGTTDEDLRAVLEQGSGLTAGVDFNLAFSPEREDPGNPNSLAACRT